MEYIKHIFIFAFLTILTQIGGVIYILSLLVIRRESVRRGFKVSGVFIVLYLICTFLIVPVTAPLFGREKVKNTSIIQPHSFFYVLANRNYVKPELNQALDQISRDFEVQNNGIQLIYLDANFPFIDRFPLLPHLSHNDGKKIDISFIYQDQNGKIINDKPSRSGYGIFEGPANHEHNQLISCKKNGNWQYDFSKYLTFGIKTKDIQFSNTGTKDLAIAVLKNQKIGKIFIEPHLKNRLQLVNSKVRFQGCKSVRHDDHIHLQLK